MEPGRCFDGHVMLDRQLAARSHYPPIAIFEQRKPADVGGSVAPHLQKAQTLRRLLAA